MKSLSRTVIEALETRTLLTAIPITYTVPENGEATRQVSLAVYDSTGTTQQRMLLAGEEQAPGQHTVYWDGLDRNGQVVPSSSYTWRLLVNDGLTAEYVTQIGVNAPGDSYSSQWVGNHAGAQLVATDTHGDVYVGGSSGEGVPATLKMTADGSKVLWRRMQYEAYYGDNALAVAGDVLYVMGADGRIFRANADSGGPDAIDPAYGLPAPIDVLWAGDPRPSPAATDPRMRITAFPETIGSVIYRNTFDAGGANIGIGSDPTTGSAFLNQVVSSDGTVTDTAFSSGTDTNYGDSAASGQLLEFSAAKGNAVGRSDSTNGPSSHFQSVVNAINALPAGTYTMTLEMDVSGTSFDMDVEKYASYGGRLAYAALYFYGNGQYDSGGDKRWITANKTLPLTDDGRTFQHFRQSYQFTLVDNPTGALPEGSFQTGHFAGFALKVSLDARCAWASDNYQLKIDNLSFTQPVTQGVNNALVVSYMDHNAIRWLDPYTGSVLATTNVTAPGDVAAGPNGLVYVISQGQVLGVSSTGASTVIVPASSLTNPYRLSYDAATGQLWVAEGAGVQNYNLYGDTTDATAFFNYKSNEIGATTLTEQPFTGTNTNAAEASGMAAAITVPAYGQVIRSDSASGAGPHLKELVSQINMMYVGGHSFDSGNWNMTLDLDYASNLSNAAGNQVQAKLIFYSNRPGDFGGDGQWDSGWQALTGTGSSNTFSRISIPFDFSEVMSSSGTLPENQYTHGYFKGFALQLWVDGTGRSSAGSFLLDNLTVRSTTFFSGHFATGLQYRNTWDDVGTPDSYQVKSFDLLMLNRNLGTDTTDPTAFLNYKPSEIGATTFTQQAWGGGDANTNGAEAGGTGGAIGLPAGGYVIREDGGITAGPHFANVVSQINALPAGTYNLTLELDYASDFSNISGNEVMASLLFYSDLTADSGGNGRWESGWWIMAGTGSSQTFSRFSHTYTFTLVNSPDGVEGHFTVGHFAGFKLSLLADGRTHGTAGTFRFDNLTLRSTNIGGGGILYRNTWDATGSDLGNLSSALAGTYGRAGGRLYGTFNPQDFRDITGIAGDGKGGLVLVEGGTSATSHSIARTAHVNALGQVEGQWFGGENVYASSVADPDDPTRVYFTTSWNAIAVAQVNYTTGSWGVIEEYDAPAFYDLFPSGINNLEMWRVRHANGQTYLVTENNGPVVLRVDQAGGKLVPVARAGNALDRNNPTWRAAVQYIGQNPDTYSTAYSWTDQDGNGVMDPNEFTLGGTYRTPGGLGSYLDTNWNYYIPYYTGGGLGSAWYVLPNLAGSGQLPRWNWANAVGTGSLPSEFASAGNVAPVAVYTDASGGVYELIEGQRYATDDRHGAAWPTYNSGMDRFAKWDSSGNLLWSLGRHAVGSMIINGIDPAYPTPPGQFHAPVRFLGETHGTIVLEDRQMYPAAVWTSDGLYAGSFLDHHVSDGLPEYVYQWSPFGYGGVIPSDDMMGSIVTMANGDVVWFTQGAQGSPTYKITGWDNWYRTQETVTVAAPADHALFQGAGLHGEYFNSTDPNNPFPGTPVLTRTDPRIWMDWSTNSPGTGVNADFSARWTGQIEPQLGENYTFSIYTDPDAHVRLYINGQLVQLYENHAAVDGWTMAPEVVFDRSLYSLPMALTAGQKYDIELDYMDPSGNAKVSLNWESFTQDRKRIPTNQLYTVQTDTTDATAFLSYSSGEIGTTTLSEQAFGGSDTNTNGAQASGMTAAIDVSAGGEVVRSDAAAMGPHFKNVVNLINALSAGTYNLSLEFDYASNFSNVGGDTASVELLFYSNLVADSGGNGRWETPWLTLSGTGSSNTFTHYSYTFTFTLVNSTDGIEGHFTVGQFAGFWLGFLVDGRNRGTVGTFRFDNLAMTSTNIGSRPDHLLYRNTWDDEGSVLNLLN